ncbi:MAG: hypothetical protein LBS88_08050 [Tannerellaceae bacterium]|jgi:hypothetical protein|nr:hypothetical protein [Tannerellaceae bacterium]
MKSITYKSVSRICILAVIATTAIFSSCNDRDYGEFILPVPVIESFTVSPQTFTFGDNLQLTAKVSDAEIDIVALNVNITANNKLVASQTLSVKSDKTVEVDASIFVPLAKDISDNADVTISLTAINRAQGATVRELTGFTGKRPYFERLYLVTESGDVGVLVPQSSNKDRYEASELSLPKSFRCRIAQKITGDSRIDYSSAVWGEKNGRIEPVDESGDYIFVWSGNGNYTTSIIFDSYTFKTISGGGSYQPGDLLVDNFENAIIVDGETLMKTSVNLTKNQEIKVFHELASPDVVYNPDFFERIAFNKVKFLGETGNYDLYYNAGRKNVIVGVASPSYPDYLVACGYGLGYPSKVTPTQLDAAYPGKHLVTTSWGFDHVLQYILFRKTGDNIFQATVLMPGEHDRYADFKPFENTDWGNEKKAGDFTFTGERIIASDDNWIIADGEQAVYRITVNLTAMTVDIVKITI